jgi:hypothetical protein
LFYFFKCHCGSNDQQSFGVGETHSRCLSPEQYPQSECPQAAW